MKKRIQEFLLFLLVSCFATAAMAQSRQVSGTVKDKQGAPIAGATVIEKGTTNGVTTDDAGVFNITVAGPGSVIVISAINFGNQEITVGQESNFALTLEAGTGNLDEVVVTALGIKRQKKSLGYAVQEVKGTVLADARETNMTNALTGKVAGLQVVRSSNGAGGSAKIVLRGFTSLTGDNQPLIVVDGIPINNFTGTTENGYWGAGYDMGNGLGDISADDIESMSVLKGPSAAALYGSRAGNGVILITTKSGRKQNGIGLNVGTNIGVESIFLQPELQNTFGQGLDGVFNEREAQSWGPKAEGQMVEKWDGTQAPLEIFDNVGNFVRNGTNQNYNISFQQQFGNTSIYTSLNRLEDRSILPGNKLTRTNMTARATSRFGKNNRWTTDTKIQYNNTAGFNRPSNGRDNSRIYTLLTHPRSLDIRDFSAGRDEFGNMIWYGGFNAINPYWQAKYDDRRDSRDRFILTGSAKYQFTDWLDAEIKGGADMFTNNASRKLYAGSPAAATGSYSTSKQTFIETNYQALITAKKDDVFGKLGGTITAGGNLMTQRSSSIGAGVGLLEIPNLFSLNNGVNNPSVSEGFSEKKINSVFGSVGLNYDGWLYLDATFRNDWSSVLSKTNRSYFYPSVSLSYVVTDMIEKMGSNLPSWLSYAKLRASYAEVGNDMGPYQLYNLYSVGKDPNGNTTAGPGGVYFDENVVNELIKNLEFGAELRFFRNRFGLDFSWYKSNATNQLIDLPLDPMSGYAARKINAGNIQNKGVEIVFDARVLDNPGGLNWNVQANFSRNLNEVIDIEKSLGVTQYSLGGFDDLAIRAVAGGLYGEIYGHGFLRVSDENSPFFGQLLLSGAGVPQRDPVQKLLGDQQARSMLGITNSFNYKGFNFSFMVDGRFGGKMFSATHVALERFGNAAATVKNGARENFVVDGVISDGAGGFAKSTVAVSPQLYYQAVSTANNLGIHEAYLFDASNIRLRNVQLGYNLPKSVLGNSPILRARITVSCNNVWMISSKMKGIDPESTFATGSNAVGFENGAPPTMRSFLFGVQLGF
ncbi:MAG: SusC/RagA family TonB-linked outer membrane protein [Flavipsychrobacter sp.]|nr:SusC/RagA family TonB-linked outer membrane protein [Flavipsychrobacter sp.]